VRARWLPPALAAALLVSCSRGGAPAALDPRNETCRWCRMPVSNPYLAAQVTAPGEEPVFFDDVGCLRDYLRDHPSDAGTVAWVADHRTGTWVRAAAAAYELCPSIDTPMGSHLIAWTDATSRRSDTAVANCAPKSPREIFGTNPPDGGKRGG
jgi:copper chaperone NosL